MLEGSQSWRIWASGLGLNPEAECQITGACELEPDTSSLRGMPAINLGFLDLVVGGSGCGSRSRSRSSGSSNK